ncbi:MAG: restriction endonuclease subunit S [Clostridiales bacterium]|nr:restriction endonuclease subunit S [Clostridiales bacterium]
MVSNLSKCENSLKWCSVSLADVISRGKRLEASVFDVEAKQARDTIMNGKYPCVPLLGENGLIEKAYYPGRFKRIYCERGNGEAFFLPSQMTDIYPKAEKFISRLTKCDISELKLKPNTLLLTRSGTIGTISLVSKTTEGNVFSDDVIRVTFKNTNDLGYCYTFLKSKLGNVVLQTNGYGSVITHLEPEHLRETYIPNAPNAIKERIHQLIIKSFQLRDESNILIDESTELLIKELHLPDIDSFDVNYYQKDAAVNTFSVKLSNLNGRVDASYHVPIVDAIIEHLNKYAEEVTTVGDKRISKDIVLAGVFKRTYVEEDYGYPFLGGKEITQLNPKTEKYLSKPIHKKRYEKELKVTENTILVTDRGTIGTITLVPKHWNGYAVSQNVLKLIPANEQIAGYIYIFLNSEWGNKLVCRQTYGSVVDMIDNNSLASVEIPLLKNKDVQVKINDLALEANKKRYEAYLLEQEALKIMDEEVIYAK